MAHVMKSTKNSIGGLTRHFERHKKENGEYQQFGNQEINISKTYLNYNLALHQKLSQLDFIKQRTSEVYCLDRKDVNLMCSWVVTKPSQVTDQEQQQFFEEVYNFLENRYGKENIISAYVHLDETTPHLHFAFIPIVFDKKKNYYKVSAKEVINRTELKTFHNDLNKTMIEIFKRDIGLLNGTTADGNKSIKELKKDSINKINNELQKLKLDLETLNIEYNVKKAYIKEYDELSDISVMYPSFTEVKEKGLLKKQEFVTVPKEKWEEKHIAANEKKYLKNATEHLEKSIENLKNDINYKKLKILEKEVEVLEIENLELINENKFLNNNLNEKEKEINTMINKINIVIKNLPAVQKEIFIDTLKNQQKEVENKDFYMDR